MKALLQIGFVRQCVPGRRLVFVVATCALAFARYRADLSPSLSSPLSQSFNGRLALENQSDSEPKQSEPKTKSFPWLSPKCFRIIHRLRVFVIVVAVVVVVCYCCCLSTILCRRASHLCCATKSPPTYPILIKLSIKYLPLHLPFPLLLCLFLFLFFGFFVSPSDCVCMCACVCVLGA